LNQVYRICLARKPSERELRILRKLLEDNQDYFQENAEDAKSLSGKNVTAESAAPEMAAWIATIRVITNLDEFVTCH
jgi:hypothetical protein